MISIDATALFPYTLHPYFAGKAKLYLSSYSGVAQR